jgi:hypothetical protein
MASAAHRYDNDHSYFKLLRQRSVPSNDPCSSRSVRMVWNDQCSLQRRCRALWQWIARQRRLRERSMLLAVRMVWNEQRPLWWWSACSSSSYWNLWQWIPW